MSRLSCGLLIALSFATVARGQWVAQYEFTVPNGASPIAFSYTELFDQWGVLYDDQTINILAGDGSLLGGTDLLEAGGDWQNFRSVETGTESLTDLNLFDQGYDPGSDTLLQNNRVFGPVGTPNATPPSSFDGSAHNLQAPLAELVVGHDGPGDAHALININMFTFTADTSFDIAQLQILNEDNLSIAAGKEVGLDSTGTKLILGDGAAPFTADVVDLNALGIGPAQAVAINDLNSRPLVLHDNQISELRRRTEWEIIGKDPIIEVIESTTPDGLIGSVVDTSSIDGLPDGTELIDLYRAFQWQGASANDNVIFVMDGDGNVYRLVPEPTGAALMLGGALVMVMRRRRSADGR